MKRQDRDWREGKSHSLRSAWIEILIVVLFFVNRLLVALLTECVDRNLTWKVKALKSLSRTPYGVRG